MESNQVKAKIDHLTPNSGGKHGQRHDIVLLLLQYTSCRQSMYERIPSLCFQIKARFHSRTQILASPCMHSN